MTALITISLLFLAVALAAFLIALSKDGEGGPKNHKRRNALASFVILAMVFACFATASRPSPAAAATPNPSPGFTLLASAARTAGTYNGAAVYGPVGARGLHVTLDVTARTSPAIASVTLLYQDPLTGDLITYPTSPTTATLSAVGTTDFVLYPGITAVTNRRFNDVVFGASPTTGPVPIVGQLLVTSGGSITATVTANFLP